MTESAPWIVLDTDVVRHCAAGESYALDLDTLRTLRGAHPISVSEVAVIELVNDLVKGQLDFGLWQGLVSQLGPLLDEDYPVIPNGRGLGAMLGLSKIDYDLSLSQRFAWEILRTARGPGDLRNGRVIEMSGVRGEFSRFEVSRLLDRVEERWAAYFERVVAELGRKGTAADRNELRASTRTVLAEDHERAPDLELVVRAMVERVVQHGRGYRPKLNDAMDFEHLFMVGLPAWICSADRRARNFARQLGGPGSDRLVCPEELLERLRKEMKGDDPVIRVIRNE